jgi:hypothetical protein
LLVFFKPIHYFLSLNRFNSFFPYTLCTGRKNKKQCDNKRKSKIKITAQRVEWSGVEWSGVEWSGVEFMIVK